MPVYSYGDVVEIKDSTLNGFNFAGLCKDRSGRNGFWFPEALQIRTNEDAGEVFLLGVREGQ